MKRAIAATVGLALSAAVAAEPYQSDLRSQFERGIDRPEPTLGWFLEPRVESALYFVGNINLAQEGSGEEEIDLAGVEVAPGFYASYNSARAQGFMDYSLIGRMWEDSDYDEVSHRLTASGAYLLAPDWLSIRGQATYSDGVIDPTQSFNYGGVGLFAPTNSNERLTASISPQISHDFRDFKFDASYRYGRVWYLDSDADPTRPIFSLYQDDSIDQSALVSLSTQRDREVTGRVFYEWQFSEFTQTVDYRYERAGVDLGARLTRTLRAIGDYGLESDLDQSTTAGGLDSSFWHAGLEWVPDERTRAEAQYGQRFFGDSWRASLSRDTRYVTIRLSYVEDPTVETRRIGINFDPDEIPLPPPFEDPSGFTSFPYVRKDAAANFIIDGARTKIRLSAHDRRREYLRDFLPDEHRQGVTLSVLRDLGAFLYGEIQTRYDDIEAGRRNPTLGEIVDEELIYRYYDSDILGRITWQAYRNFETSAEVGYLNRSGSVNYDGAWLAFRFHYTF